MSSSAGVGSFLGGRVVASIELVTKVQAQRGADNILEFAGRIRGHTITPSYLDLTKVQGHTSNPSRIFWLLAGMQEIHNQAWTLVTKVLDLGHSAYPLSLERHQ